MAKVAVAVASLVVMWHFERLLRALGRHYRLGRAGEACGCACSPLLVSEEKMKFSCFNFYYFTM